MHRHREPSDALWWDHSIEPEKRICKKRIKGGACAVNGLIRWFLDVTVNIPFTAQGHLRTKCC